LTKSTGFLFSFADNFITRVFIFFCRRLANKSLRFTIPFMIYWFLALTQIITLNSFDFSISVQEAFDLPRIETSSCPIGMIEIEGDYCPIVQQVCLKSQGRSCLEFQQPTTCLSKETIHKHYCIDTYEYPNVKGALPSVMMSWDDMTLNCQNQGKRVCQESEWTFACEGEEMRPYPYGYRRDKAACNIDHSWRPFHPDKLYNPDPIIANKELNYLDQRVPSGAMPNCVSPFGVHDMTGNADEWVSQAAPKPFRGALMGGHWVGGIRNQCRPKTTFHEESFRFYETGSRCCEDVNE
jgi:formylglycine-generating enzyme